MDLLHFDHVSQLYKRKLTCFHCFKHNWCTKFRCRLFGFVGSHHFYVWHFGRVFNSWFSGSVCNFRLLWFVVKWWLFNTKNVNSIKIYFSIKCDSFWLSMKCHFCCHQFIFIFRSQLTMYQNWATFPHSNAWFFFLYMNRSSLI